MQALRQHAAQTNWRLALQPSTEACGFVCHYARRWEFCPACKRSVNLQQEECAACLCGALVQRQQHETFQSWVQCSGCGKWREVPQAAVEQLGQDDWWDCSMLYAGELHGVAADCASMQMSCTVCCVLLWNVHVCR
jgi:CW-type Zinc Finger